MKCFILCLVVTVSGMAHAAINTPTGFTMVCQQTKNPGAEQLLLTVNAQGAQTLEIIDQTALQPVGLVKLWDASVNQTSRIISVDHWESHVGAVQLIAVFDAGAFKSKHVYLDARFGREKDNRGSFGLKKFNELSDAKLDWVCEEK